MTRVDLDVTTWVTREPEDDGWDNGDRDGKVGEPYIATPKDRYAYTYRGEDTDLKPPFYVVYAGYYTGNTFGTDYDGTIVAVLKDEDEAYEVLAAAEATTGFSFEVKGKQYHVPWNGYFEHLDRVDICRLA